MKTIEELECDAYLSGNTTHAALLARIADLELQVDALTDNLDDAEYDSNYSRLETDDRGMK